MPRSAAPTTWPSARCQRAYARLEGADERVIRETDAEVVTVYRSYGPEEQAVVPCEWAVTGAEPPLMALVVDGQGTGQIPDGQEILADDSIGIDPAGFGEGVRVTVSAIPGAADAELGETLVGPGMEDVAGD